MCVGAERVADDSLPPIEALPAPVLRPRSPSPPTPPQTPPSPWADPDNMSPITPEKRREAPKLRARSRSHSARSTLSVSDTESLTKPALRLALPPQPPPPVVPLPAGSDNLPPPHPDQIADITGPQPTWWQATRALAGVLRASLQRAWEPSGWSLPAALAAGAWCGAPSAHFGTSAKLAPLLGARCHDHDPLASLDPNLDPVQHFAQGQQASHPLLTPPSPPAYVKAMHPLLHWASKDPLRWQHARASASSVLVAWLTCPLALQLKLAWQQERPSAAASVNPSFNGPGFLALLLALQLPVNPRILQNLSHGFPFT